jgi:hypothetical protein
MTGILLDIVAKLDSLPEDVMICAKRPWGPSAEAWVGPPGDNFGVPPHVRSAGYEYFLEVFVANEVLEVLKESAQQSVEAKLRLLLFYAENDSFPDWVYR